MGSLSVGESKRGEALQNSHYFSCKSNAERSGFNLWVEEVADAPIQGTRMRRWGDSERQSRKRMQHMVWEYSLSAHVDLESKVFQGPQNQISAAVPPQVVCRAFSHQLN